MSVGEGGRERNGGKGRLWVGGGIWVGVYGEEKGVERRGGKR